MVSEKVCSKCKKSLPLSKFRLCTSIYRKTPFYYSSCKDCNNLYIKMYRLNNLEKIREGYKITDKKRKDKKNLKRKEWRHKKGISKKYAKGSKIPTPSDFVRVKKTPTQEMITKHKKLKATHSRLYNYRKRGAGKISINTIRLVYEDNIKKYGTLTCYLCNKVIETEKEHLEHKNPLSRGGTNDYENLGISCSYCNLSKHNKTVEEYLNKNGVR